MAWLKETLSGVAHYLHTRGPHFILPILTVLAFQVDVFGLGAATQAQSENTIVRLAAPFYEATEQKSVVAVLMDKPYVERAPNGTGGSPIPYRKFTAIIDQLLPLDPAAIYIGAMFELQPTDTTDLDQLLEIIKEAAERDIPILLPMRTKLTEKTRGGGEPTCTLLDASSSIVFDEKSVLPAIRDAARESNGGIRFVAANWHGCLNRYPLVLDTEGKVPSPALLLAGKASCEGGDDCPPSGLSRTAVQPYLEPMLVRWSAFPTPERFSFGSPCTPAQDPSLHGLGTLLWNDIHRSAVQSTESEALRGELLACHYIDEVLASNLIDDRSRVADFIRGRIVLIGTAPSMTQHWIHTPTNGDVPDVIMHAAATENLLTLDASYTRNMDASIALFLQLAVAIVVAAACLAIGPGRQPSSWAARPGVAWWGLGICLILALTVSMNDLPQHWESLLIMAPLTAAWLMHATVATLTTLAFFTVGAAMMVMCLMLGTVPINWIGVLLAGLTAGVGAEFR